MKPASGESITTADGLPSNRVQSLIAGAGQMWMGVGGTFGEAYGIAGFDPAQQTFQQFLGLARSRLPYNYFSDLAVGQPGTRWVNQVWAGTGNKLERQYGEGALLLKHQGTQDQADDVWTQFTKENTDDDGVPPWTGLASNNVTAVVLDGDNVWFGTQPVTWESRPRGSSWTDGGLSVFDGERWTTRTVDNTGGSSAGLRSNAISALAVGCRGELWIGQSRLGDSAGTGFGIVILDTQGDPHNLDNDVWQDPIGYPVIPSNAVTDFAADCERDQMWVATMPYFDGNSTAGGGLARYDYATDEWDTWTAADGIETYARGDVTGMFLSVHVDPDGTVWAGGWGSQATSRQELQDTWPFVPASVNWFRDGQWSSQVFEHDGGIWDLAVDENNRVWAGTSRGGMDRPPFEGRADDVWPDYAAGGVKHTIDGAQWAAWTPDNSPLVTNDVSVIEVGPDGDVWAGTNGWGLMRFSAPLPVIPGTDAFRTEVEMPSDLKLGESATLEVTLHNESAEVVLDNPRFRVRIQQDQATPVLVPAQPEVISRSVTVEPDSSITATFHLQTVDPGVATLSVDIIGDVGSMSESTRYMTRLSARPTQVRVIGKKFYLPLILSD